MEITIFSADGNAMFISPPYVAALGCENKSSKGTQYLKKNQF